MLTKEGAQRQPPLQRVALQFPDEALIDAVPVYHALNHALAALTKTPPTLYILADTSYGSCCVDQVTASHVQAEAVVHYGHTCLSPTSHMPTLYDFPKHGADIDDATQLSLIHISEPARQAEISYAVFCLKKKKCRPY